LKSLKENSAAENIYPGVRVLVAGKRAGTVHFVGETEFAQGTLMIHCNVDYMRVSEVTVKSHLLMMPRGQITKKSYDNLMTCECLKSNL